MQYACGAIAMENAQWLYERIRRVQAGNQAVQDELVAQHLNLVRSVVWRFGLRGEEWDDLFQTGCIGLVKALHRFDCSRKVQFSSYAVPMIVGELKQYFRDNQKIHVNRSLRELARRVRQMQEKLCDSLGREPTVKELATAMAVMPIQIAEAIESMQTVTSLDEPQVRQGKSEAVPLLDNISADAVRPDDVNRLFLAERMARLPKREREILTLRFWQDKTQAEVAKRLEISQVHVSRLEKKALLFLRQENQADKSR